MFAAASLYKSHPLHIFRPFADNGFVYTSHQKVVLEIDFSGALWGYTEITIIPTSSELRTIHLHSRQCSIHSVTVGGHPADFTHHDPLTNITMGGPAEAQDSHRHTELKRKVYAAMQEGDEGELSIAIPAEVSLRQSIPATSGYLGGIDVSTPEPQTPGYSQASGLEFSPIVVHIAYSLRNPVDGFEFVLPTESYPFRVPHAYTTPSSPDSARCWVPCVDNLWEKCLWEFEFVVPRYLEERDMSQDEDEPIDAIPTMVICSGDLVEQVAHPNNSNKTIFLFTQAVPTSIQHIAFAAGPFHLLSIPTDSSGEESSGSSQPHIYAFCLTGQEQYLNSSTTCLRTAMSFYTSECGSYPFGSYKMVFVDQLPSQRFDSATLTLMNTDVLHGGDAIEQAMEIRQAIGHALACQWMGINIIPKTWSDLWLVNGLALYLNGSFTRKLFGNNDYRFRLKKDMQRVISADNGNMPPLCQPHVLDPPDNATLPFINLKAPLVLHILDRRLGKSGTSLGLSRVLPKLFLTALSGELQNNALSTHTFLRTCRKVSSVDLRSFAEQWIYGSGCPSFNFSAAFNRKKMAVEITMRQDSPAHTALQRQGNEVSKLLKKPVSLFEGQMTIRIHEADGTPYEHVLDIRSNFKRYEVPFNTKYKRVRRNTKRYLARQAAAQAAAEGDADAAEAMGMVDIGFGLEIWEKEQERDNWKVADWTEEDEAVMSGATYEWIRMDADFEWIANIQFDQPDFMWVSQLQRDRDVVAQLEAVYALAEKPTLIVSSTLTKTVLVSNYYFRIRCEAASALIKCAIHKLDFLGLFHLFKLFLRYCYDPEDPNQDLFSHKYVPKPNDFTDLAEYFVRKTLVSAISQVRFENGKTPSVVRQFFVDQLRYNDNTSNPYTDGFYISTLISAAAHANVSSAPPERGELLPTETGSDYTPEDKELVKQTLTEVDRYRSMDRLIPSPHNIVTIAALEFYMLLGVANLVAGHPRVFFPFTREGNYTQVRIMAFDGLFLTKWCAPQIMRYVLAVMANDPSRVVRRHVARNACYSLALLVQMGEMKAIAKESESLLIEEDGNSQEKMKDAAKKSEMETMIKILRKDREVGKNEVLREFLMPIALNPDVDHEVRWCILKLADLLIKPLDEVAPSVKIHIPSTPVVETAPSLPVVKVAPPKAPRTIKTGGPPPKKPLLMLNPPSAKLKLPGSPHPDNLPLKPPVTPAADITRRSVVFATPEIPSKVKVKSVKLSKPHIAKPASVPKAQSGGMSSLDMRACRHLLKKLQSHKRARIFLQPVDPIRDHAPNYFEIIKDPMDLCTIGAKLEDGMYKDRFAFQEDFRLMISNAKRYNVVGSFAHNEAIALETVFEKVWASANNEVEKRTAQPLPVLDEAPPLSRVARPAPKPKHDSPTVSIASNSGLPGPSKIEESASISIPRPTIKLKVGSQKKDLGTPQPASAMPAPKLKVKKPKASAPPLPSLVVDAPPPPYVDDGSHDILQEVLAIEREKNEQRQRSLEKAGIVTGKRKKENEDTDEDEILTLATPAKKERPSPPGPSSSKPLPVPTARTIRAPPTLQFKKDKTSDLSRPPTANNSPIPSVKGKEKEVPSTKISGPPRKTSQATPINEKKCKELIKNLVKLPESFIFRQPVDPILDGCPTYFDEIEHPMDFGTISTKLEQNQYVTMEAFKTDVDLVFSNCRQFNRPEDFPTICANAVEKVFKKEWPKLMERKLTWQEKRSLQGIMTTIGKDPISFIFREPVDPILLGIPQYFDVIPKKDARDLRTIRQKLDADKYDTVDAFEADLKLMVDNAIKFNGAESEVGLIAFSMRDLYVRLLDESKINLSKKRKEGDLGTTQPLKKIKFT